MKYFILIFSLFFLLPGLYGQAPYATGLILDDEEYDGLSHTSKNIQISTGQKSISRKIDLSPFCPEIRHQGEIASCVGWSAGYGAMTIERAIKNNWTDKKKISEKANSALFIYNQIIEDNCNMGLTMPQALGLLQEKGNCLARDFDKDPNDCPREVPGHLFEKAAAYKIQDYIPLFEKDAPSEEKIRNTKLVLAQKKPVIVGMKILSNFYNISEGVSSWFPTIGDTNYAGGHAMVVVGYDDDRFDRPGRSVPDDMKGAFKLMNSWGKNWGERGYIWIRYAHFAEYCRHAYAIMLADGQPIDFNLDMTPEEKVAEEEATTSQLRSLKGAFGFRQFTGKIVDGAPVFVEAGVQLMDHQYTLTGSQQTGDIFQLYVQSGFDNGYIYVFSVDAIGKAEIHFPKSEAYNEAFKGQNESALLLSSGSLLTIPSQNSGLKLTHPGKDHLVVLFSTQKIKPKYIEYLCDQLSQHKDRLKGRLLELLDKFMVPLPDITYERAQMGFDISTRSDGKIVPIVLTVNVN